MPATCTFEYAVIRVVPRVEREEFLNAGIILSCPAQDFLAARIELERSRLTGFAPDVDVMMVEHYLNAIPLVCAGTGPVGHLPQRARFHWLVAPRSTMIQVSPVHSGLCENPAATLEHLMKTMVRPVLPDKVALKVAEFS